MSKHTQIDKIQGEPFLDNHYCLYSEGKLVAGDVPFEALASTEEMLFWIKRMRNMIAEPAKFHADAYAEMYEDVDKLIAKATGGDE